MSNPWPAMNPLISKDRVAKLDDYPFQFGDTSDLYKAMYTGHGLKEVIVTIKVLRGVSSIPKEQALVKSKVVDLLNEWAKIQEYPVHPNICTFYGYVEGWGFLPSPVVEYFKNGNAVRYIKDHPEADHMTILRDMTRGLDWLHKRSIVHGNLKASNVLIRDDGVACLSDLQLSTITSTTHFTTAGVAGGARHIAPEIMNPPDADDDEESDAAQYTFESDVYSWAMTALEIRTGQPPFPNIKLDSVVIAKVVKGIRPERPEVLQTDDTMWSLLTRCWDQVPANRPSIGNVLQALTLAQSRPSFLTYFSLTRKMLRSSIIAVFMYFQRVLVWFLPKRWRPCE